VPCLALNRLALASAALVVNTRLGLMLPLLRMLHGLAPGRYGGKLVMLYGVLVWGLANFALPFATSPGHTRLLVGLRSLQGLAQGVVFPATFHLVAAWFPLRERTAAVALALSGVDVGVLAMAASLPAYLTTAATTASSSSSSSTATAAFASGGAGGLLPSSPVSSESLVASSASESAVWVAAIALKTVTSSETDPTADIVYVNPMTVTDSDKAMRRCTRSGSFCSGTVLLVRGCAPPTLVFVRSPCAVQGGIASSNRARRCTFSSWAWSRCCGAAPTRRSRCATKARSG